MSGKLKGLFAVLALTALASGAYILSALQGSSGIASLADPTRLKAQTLGLITPDADSDHDGLTDREEPYWRTSANNPDTDGDGFKDGEEVVSGHDPAKKGPFDWLDNSKNITQRAASLTAGGIITGDLDPASPNYEKALSLLSRDIADVYRKNNQVVVDSVRLAPNSSPEEVNRYGIAMAFAIKNVITPALNDAEAFIRSVRDVKATNPSALTENPARLSAFTTSAHALAKITGERAAKIAAIPVPPSMATSHKDGIKLLRIIQRQYELAGTIKDDPLQGTLAIQQLALLHVQGTQGYLLEFLSTLTKTLAANAN